MSAIITVGKFSEIAANRRRYIAALRSGKYTKIRGNYFGKTETECCAGGVAAREFGLPTNVFPLSQLIGDRLGIYGEPFTEILTMNDDEDKSFEEIADYLEAEWSLA